MYTVCKLYMNMYIPHMWFGGMKGTGDPTTFDATKPMCVCVCVCVGPGRPMHPSGQRGFP